MKSAIDRAWAFLRMRKFADAISVLNEKREIYEESFDYYYTLGLAFLYAGDSGSATQNFEAARKIKLNDANLLLCQAAIYLRRGDTERAVQYYLDILDLEPDNADAKRALEFVRTHGDYEEICRWVDDGRIERYYPSLGVNPLKIRNAALALFFGAVFGILLVQFWPGRDFSKGARADLSSLAITSVQDGDLIEKDLSGQSYKTILTSRQIKASYNKALDYFQGFRDNAAQHELNKILFSNASAPVKQKCHELMNYFSVPGFDSLRDNFSYQEVAAEPDLYLDCYVDWGGRVANVAQGENSYSCSLLVGYEDLKNVQAAVPVYFDFLPVPVPDAEKPLRILGRVTVKDGVVSLEGRSIFQSVKEF